MHAELWYALVDASISADDLARVEGLLSAVERERSRRFYFDADRRQFVVAHALVRTMLSHVAGVEAGAWEFHTNRHGKPEVAGPAEFQHLRFNLSHTRELAACIVAAHVDVGLDVESLAGRVNGVELAASVFSPSEVRALDRLAPAERPGAFLEYWTLKEAYVKARGAGLSLPLNAFSFVLTPEGPPRIVFDPEMEDDPRAWQFWQFRPGQQHWMAAALRRGTGRDISISCRRVIPGDLCLRGMAQRDGGPFERVDELNRDTGERNL